MSLGLTINWDPSRSSWLLQLPASNPAVSLCIVSDKVCLSIRARIVICVYIVHISYCQMKLSESIESSFEKGFMTPSFLTLSSLVASSGQKYEELIK